MPWLNATTLRQRAARRSALLVALVLAVSAAPRLARAIPYESADSMSAAAATPEGMKSPGRAFLYSFLGTAIPVGVGGATALGKNELSAGAMVAIGGAVAGPSLGHFYAQRSGRAIRGIVARGAAAAIIAGTLVAAEDDTDSNSLGVALFLAGSVLGIVFLVADIAGAPHSARVHNETIAERARLGVAPRVSPIEGAPGAAVSVAF